MSIVNGLGQKTHSPQIEDASSNGGVVPSPLLIEVPSLDYSSVGGPGRAEAIDRTNDPMRFGVTNLETRIDRLAMKGSVKQRPWADTYWPTFQDGINHRWQSSGDFKSDLSPAEKYDAAFHGWDPEQVRGKKPFNAEWGGFDKPFDQGYYDNLGPVAKYCSNSAGNKRTRDASKAGLLNSDGTAKNGREEQDYGGIASWEGLCHGWVPASILELEPLHAAEHNGVKFEVSDIKALLIACYNSSDSRMIGGRNGEKPNEIKLDANGRPTKTDMRDINPGTMHIILGTMIGRDGKSIAEDRTGHYQVWNQPVSEYRVTKMDEITQAQAAALVKDTDSTYDYNPQASRFFHVKTEVDYITESAPSTRPNAGTDGQERTDPYEYILEVDRAGNIIGGEWLGSSRTDHPDFLWNAIGDGGNPLAPGLDIAEVRTLLKKSREGSTPPPGGNGVDVAKTATLNAKQTEALEVIRVQRDGVLEFTLTGGGDMDVYAKKGAAPRFNASSGQPTRGGTDMFMFEQGSNERKTLSVKAGDEVHVVMRGYVDNTTAKLAIKQL